MKKRFTLTTALIVFTTYGFAQPSIQWQKKFGGSGAEGARALAITPDGGFIMTGFSYSSDGDLTENKGGVRLLGRKNRCKW